MILTMETLRALDPPTPTEALSILVVQSKDDVTEDLLLFIGDFLSNLASQIRFYRLAFTRRRTIEGQAYRPHWPAVILLLEGEVFNGKRLQFGGDYITPAILEIKRHFLGYSWTLPNAEVNKEPS